MKSILVEETDAFNVSAGNIIRDSFVKTELPPFRPPDFTTNIQAFDA